jgi:hypothetical protein
VPTKISRSATAELTRRARTDEGFSSEQAETISTLHTPNFM